MEHEVASDTKTIKNNGPRAPEENPEHAGVFFADVSHLCDRVLQRWMPQLVEDPPGKTDLRSRCHMPSRTGTSLEIEMTERQATP